MPTIELHPAQRDELQTIENLMQFYMHDFSQWLPLNIAEHGFFSVHLEDDYWRNPATQPFLIRVDGELAGFVIVDKDIHIDGAEHNISYFFLARRFRGQGVAQFVVSALLSRLPGQWQIFHIDANLPAQRFWARLIPELSAGAFTCQPREVDGYPCTFYVLHAPASVA
ncbi:Predicted acetyltransferase [Pseudomonas koreensis]|uniref:GNAT family N-acetyltransferase n=1 Tax=Pseudomonas koreensis TaxID=198620 RepID=UPI00087D7152|nr:GNAT family N-acetyltransferase [Pseudomonas koreensis]KAB0513296.1 GNAT family N-acetyltransferase [Pseudomonas koreensis]NNA63764.1 GNAT family N-acetyltransferase [Pseudomonas koreensis]GGK38764.1 acetyltransferase [Pseudomonas koreensis]SDE27832.1 Predicted acetyltransferase [Pseudomonas koreensis]